MADPLLSRSNLKWEDSLAAISLAGIRPLDFSAATVATASEDTYTIVNKATKRVIIAHSGSGDEDIRFALNATATATSFPIFPNMYFVVEVAPGEVVHTFNNNAGNVVVYYQEIR